MDITASACAGPKGEAKIERKEEEKEKKKREKKALFISMMRIITGKRIQDKAMKVSMSPASSIARFNASVARGRERVRGRVRGE